MNVSEGLSAVIVGRYALFDEIASGGMATVHYGRLMGPEGFSRTVAIKRLHPHLARNPEFVTMFLDEARVAARVRHPNVVPTLDIVNLEGELFLVMEYVQGETLSRLLRAARAADKKMPPDVAAAIVVGVLHGLHAAHEAKNERGEPLNIVHRDVSPQNIMIGLDGIPRLVDFGVAKAAGRVQTTRDGQLKGKIAYMAPEQVRGAQPNRLMDIYATAIVFWEMLTGERLFGGDNDVTVLERALHMEVARPSTISKEVPPAVDVVVLRGLERDPEKRFQSAREMAREIENVSKIASVSKVGEWVESIAGAVLMERAAKVAEIESVSHIGKIRTIPPRALEEGDAKDAAKPGERLVSHNDVDLEDLMASEVHERPRFDRRVVFGALIGVCALVGIAVIVRTLRSPPAPVVVQPTASGLTPSASAAVVAPPVTPSTTAPTTDPAVASVTTPPHESARPVPTHGNLVRSYPTATSGKPNCNPPYTVDAKGVKEYKVDCL